MIPWHELFGFAALWILACAAWVFGYCTGRRREEDKWIAILVEFARDLDRKAQEHRADVERIPR